MRARVLHATAATVLALALAIPACTSNDAHPPISGDCVPVDGSVCNTTVVSGSSGGEGGADGGGCSVNAGDSQCGVCATARCCAELEHCESTTDCTNLESCEGHCGGGAACIMACEAQFPAGVTAVQLVASCLAGDCPICNESGVGDPCGAQYPACVAGLTCNGLWCTKGCVNSSDCAGIGAGGGNFLDNVNACIATSQGDTCVPGCGGGPSGCTYFPGTYCLATTAADGSHVSVCASLPDASTTD